MKFNRQLFKEAFKAGYKKAKINESTNKGTNFFDFLFSNFGPYYYQVYCYDKKENRRGPYTIEFDSYSSNKITLIGKRANASKKFIWADDIVSIDDSQTAFILTLEDGSEIHIFVYAIQKASEIK